MAASTVPSPPSATGSSSTGTSGRAIRSPVAMCAATSGALSDPLNLSGETRTWPLGPSEAEVTEWPFPEAGFLPCYCTTGSFHTEELRYGSHSEVVQENRPDHPGRWSGPTVRARAIPAMIVRFGTTRHPRHANDP